MSERDIVRDLNELIKSWREEISSEELLPLDAELIRAVKDFIFKDAADMLNSASDPLQRAIFQRELELLTFVLKDLFRARTAKIVAGAIAGEAPKNLSFSEFSLFRKLQKIIKRSMEEIAEDVTKPFSLSSLECPVRKPKGKTRVLFTIKTRLRDFVSPDGYLYRGLKPGDIVHADKAISGRNEGIRKIKDSWAET